MLSQTAAVLRRRSLPLLPGSLLPSLNPSVLCRRLPLCCCCWRCCRLARWHSSDTLCGRARGLRRDGGPDGGRAQQPAGREAAGSGRPPQSDGRQQEVCAGARVVAFQGVARAHSQHLGCFLAARAVSGVAGGVQPLYAVSLAPTWTV